MISNKKEWLTYYAEKTGVPEERLEKFFKEELEGEKPVDTPLEVPDRIEILYRYSYGGHSRFFRELRDNARLYGTRCKKCGTVYLPPRSACGDCYEETEWVPIGNEGTVHTCTTVYYATSVFFYKTPFICAYIKMDGADTEILQNIFMKDISKARVGMRVKAVFKDARMGDMGDFWFEPVEEKGTR